MWPSKACFLQISHNSESLLLAPLLLCSLLVARSSSICPTQYISMRIPFLIALFAIGSASGATRGGLRNLSGTGENKSGIIKERPSKKGMMSKLAKNGMGMKNHVNCASVDEGDILANNGIFHKITRLLIPPEQSLLDFVVGNPDLTALAAAVVRAGLVDALSGPGPFTLFAPSDNTFGDVPVELLDLLLTNDEFIPHVNTDSTHDEIRFDYTL